MRLFRLSLPYDLEAPVIGNDGTRAGMQEGRCRPRAGCSRRLIFVIPAKGYLSKQLYQVRAGALVNMDPLGQLGERVSQAMLRDHLTVEVAHLIWLRSVKAPNPPVDCAGGRAEHRVTFKHGINRCAGLVKAKLFLHRAVAAPADDMTQTVRACFYPWMPGSPADALMRFAVTDTP